MSSSCFLWFFVRNMGPFFPCCGQWDHPCLHRRMGQETHRIQCIMGAPRLRGHFLASSTSEEKSMEDTSIQRKFNKKQRRWDPEPPIRLLNLTPIRVLIWNMGTAMGLSLPGVPIPGLRGAFFRGVPSKLRPRVPRIMCLGASHMASIQEPLDQRCVS